MYYVAGRGADLRLRMSFVAMKLIKVASEARAAHSSLCLTISTT